MATIRFRRGINNNRLQITPLAGEPIWATDTKQLFVGDGSTAGGVPVNPFSLAATSGNMGNLMTFGNDVGTQFKGISRAELLGGYYTSAQVDALTATFPDTVVKVALKSQDADRLNGLLPSEYVRVARISDIPTENDSAKIASTKATATMYYYLDNKVNAAVQALDTKIDKSVMSSSVDSTSKDTVATSFAVNTAKVLATQALAKGNQGVTDAATAKARADDAYTLGTTASNTAQAATQTAQAARSAPDLPTEQKRRITYGSAGPSGGSEGDLYVQY